MESKFLKDKVVYLKPIPRSSGMVKDPKHIAYFKMEGAFDMYPLKIDEKTLKYINPFSSEEEMKFFSEVLGEDLNPYKTNNTFWQKYFVRIVKTPELMNVGKKFDLSDVHDALAYKVLLTWKGEIIDNADEVNKYPTARYVFVDEKYEENKATEELEEIFKIGTYYGELKTSDKKMREFINVYYINKPNRISIPEDFTTKSLIMELDKIIKKDKDGFINTYEDPDFKTKAFIAKAIDKGAIKKLGVATYAIEGVASEYTFNELLAQIKEWAKTKTEPIYAKMIAIVNNN